MSRKGASFHETVSVLRILESRSGLSLSLVPSMTPRNQINPLSKSMTPIKVWRVRVSERVISPWMPIQEIRAFVMGIEKVTRVASYIEMRTMLLGICILIEGCRKPE
jgi:hypothetical protein